MIAEQLSRSQLQRQIQSKFLELRRLGQDNRDLKKLVKRLHTVPGQSVAEICNYWSRSCAELRPVYHLLWLAVAVVSACLFFKVLGLTAASMALLLSGLLALIQNQLLWVEEHRFSMQLLACADSACISTPLGSQ